MGVMDTGPGRVMRGLARSFGRDSRESGGGGDGNQRGRDGWRVRGIGGRRGTVGFALGVVMMVNRVPACLSACLMSPSLPWPASGVSNVYNS